MKVISPITVTNAILTASNVTENDHSEWDISTTYDADDYVIVIGTTHKIYQSAQGSNLGNDPTTDDGTWWTEISATNRWKAFDQKIADQVSKSGTITYSITPASIVTGIGFLGLSAAEVRVQVYDTNPTEIYDETVNLIDDSGIVSWFTYFTFDAADYDTEALFVDIPAYAGYQIDITIGDGTGTAKVGQIIPGKVQTLGEQIDGTSIGIEDFSTKSRDDFGNAILVERAFADEVSFRFVLQSSDARRVKRILSDLRAVPALYFADEEMISYGATVYGFFKDFDIPLSSGGVSFANLEIEGLT